MSRMPKRVFSGYIHTMQVFLHISGWFPEGCIEVVGNAGNDGEADTGGGR